MDDVRKYLSKAGKESFGEKCLRLLSGLKKR